MSTGRNNGLTRIPHTYHHYCCCMPLLDHAIAVERVGVEGVESVGHPVVEAWPCCVLAIVTSAHTVVAVLMRMVALLIFIVAVV